MNKSATLIGATAGSLDHEVDDANSFAEWGVDMLKYDSCYHMGRIGTPQISFNRFKVMSDALKATGRNILLNLCNWGEDSVHTVCTLGMSWQLQSDIDIVGYVHFKLVAHHRRHLRQLHSKFMEFIRRRYFY